MEAMNLDKERVLAKLNQILELELAAVVRYQVDIAADKQDLILLSVHA